MKGPNWLDRAVGWISPQAGLNRLEARVRTASALQAYEAAAETRRTAGWRTDQRGPNTEVGYSLGKIRARARDLSTNNSWGNKAVRAWTTRVVGPGILPKPMKMGVNKRDSEIAMGTWLDHAETPGIDPAGEFSAYGVQSMTMREMVDAGEGLIVRRWLSDGQQRAQGVSVPYQVQCLEPDYLDTFKHEKLEDGGYIIQGVEYGKAGNKRAFWLYPEHPGDFYGIHGSNFSQSQRVPAVDVIHLRRATRAGQVRGVPWGASCLLTLRDLDDFTDAELHRQRIAACFTAFVSDAQNLGSDGSYGVALPGAPGVNPNEYNELDSVGKLQPGAIKVLPPGRTIHLASPPTTDGFPDYVRLTLHQIAAGYGTTYVALTGDLSDANYSSGRMGHLDWAAEIECVQNLNVVPTVCAGLWRWHNEALLASGQIAKPVPARWSVPKRPMVDPQKETTSLKEQVQAGFVSLSEAQRQVGQEPEEILRELAEDKRRAVNLDLELSVFQAPPGTVVDQGGSEPDEEKESSETTA